jgi:putative salt-induced outer membrane protein
MKIQIASGEPCWVMDGFNYLDFMKHFAFASALLLGATSVFAQQETGWKTTAGVNVSVNRGNSDTLLAGANILTLKKWDKNELSAGADAVYGNNRDLNTGDRVTTAQNYGAFLQYNRLVTERWYFLGRGDARQDRVADIKYRVGLSPGVGYYFIKNEKTTLSGELGPGLVFEQFENGPSSKYFTLRAGEKFTHKFNDKVRLVQEADITPKVDEFENYVFNFSATLEADLTEKLAVRLTLQDTYRSEPAPGRKENDLRIMAGIAYKF